VITQAHKITTLQVVNPCSLISLTYLLDDCAYLYCNELGPTYVMPLYINTPPTQLGLGFHSIQHGIKPLFLPRPPHPLAARASHRLLPPPPASLLAVWPSLALPCLALARTRPIPTTCADARPASSSPLTPLPPPPTCDRPHRLNGDALAVFPITIVAARSTVDDVATNPPPQLLSPTCQQELQPPNADDPLGLVLRASSPTTSNTSSLQLQPPATSFCWLSLPWPSTTPVQRHRNRKSSRARARQRHPRPRPRSQGGTPLTLLRHCTHTLSSLPRCGGATLPSPPRRRPTRACASPYSLPVPSSLTAHHTAYYHWCRGRPMR
jgi:hypothetical protein